MSDFTVSLPTVISSSSLLQAIARGVRGAAAELGEGYFTVIHENLSMVKIQVFRSSTPPTQDPLSTAQPIPEKDRPLWSFDFRNYSSEDAIPEDSRRYFFLSDRDALSHIETLERETRERVLEEIRSGKKEGASK